MSDNHTSTEAAGQPIPTLSVFAPSDETPKLLMDFPTATASMYETYLALWWIRKQKFNTFVAFCNNFYGGAVGGSDDAQILPLIAEVIDLLTRA